MKNIILVTIFILFSFHAFAWNPFKKKVEIELIPEKIVKVCYYYMEYKDNEYAVVSVFQDDCNGIVLRGLVSGRKIIEYNEDLGVKNMQTPTDDETFREKVKSLWPDMKKINFDTQ